MKTRETKQRDLEALTQSLQSAKSAMVVSFTGLSVNKDQEFRNTLRAAGAKYEVVKNTLARIAVKETPFEQAADSFKGVTAIAWTENDPVVLTKAMSKFMKDNADIYTFKTGVIDGKLIDLKQLTTIASLPSKEELISKLLYVLNAQAQRIVTVINAVPRDLAVVIKQIGEKAPAAEAKIETPAPAAETKTEEAAPAAEAGSATPVEAAADEAATATEEAAPAATEEASPAAVTEGSAPAAEAEAAPTEEVSAEKPPAAEGEQAPE
jgi:large subunit ribosomal protein L10